MMISRISLEASFVLAILTGAALASAQPSAQPMTLPSGVEATPGGKLSAASSASEVRVSIEEIKVRTGTRAPLISSPFGWRTDPIRGARRRHAGVDLPGRSGTSIHATGPGVVSRAGWAGGYGKLIEIEHPGGIRTRFGHLSRILVGRGERVVPGQRIGAMGSTGRSTGPHLHYEVRVNDTAADPLRYMGQATTRSTYITHWGEERTTEARWTGWPEATLGTLPQAVIR